MKGAEMMVDPAFCMSSFLTFRYIADENRTFKAGMSHVYRNMSDPAPRLPCATAEDIDSRIREQLEGMDLTHAAILLSGGIDSGILASYMPAGMKSYTAISVAEGAALEAERARRICEINGLEHVVVDVTWQDYLDSIDGLMLHDGCPVFANEPQVYKLAKRIRDDGHDLIIFGDNADMAFGGMDRMLSKDWTFDQWMERYTFVDPERALKAPVPMTQVYEAYRAGENGVDIIRFLNEVFAASSSGAYRNAFDYAGIRYFDPYARMVMAEPLDLARVRAGDSKYLLRELYRQKYPGLPVPEKIAMLRATDTWLSSWEGPRRPEFLPGCTGTMRGEQKFLVYSLERFLNLIQ